MIGRFQRRRSTAARLLQTPDGFALRLGPAAGPADPPDGIEIRAAPHQVAPCGRSCCAGPQPDPNQIPTAAGSAGSARPTGGRRKQRTTVMRTRRNIVAGAAAAALALTACGIAAAVPAGRRPGLLRCRRGTPRTASGSLSRGTSPRSSGTSCGRAGSCRGAAAAGGPVTGHRPAGPGQGQAGRRAARRAAGPGQVSARAVPVAARAAGTRSWRVPGPGGRGKPRLTASAWGVLFREAGEQGADPLGQWRHPPVLKQLQRPAQAGFGIAGRSGQPQHLRLRGKHLAQ